MAQSDNADSGNLNPQEPNPSFAASEVRFRTLFEAAQDGLILLEGQTGKILEVNPFLARMVGLTPDQIRGQSIRNFLPADEIELVTSKLAALSSLGSVRHETLVKSVDQRVTPVEVVCRPYPENGRRVILCIVRDISERKKLEAEQEKLRTQFHHAQKMEAIGRLAAGIAHDYNNLLTSIIGFCDMARDDLERDHPVQHYLAQISNAAWRTVSLNRQILAFASRQMAVPQPLILNEVISGTLKLLRRLMGENIRLEWIPASELWPVMIDPAQVDQILANLCVNARDAITGHGTVTIETANVVLDDTYCASHAGFKPGEYTMLAVSDTGCGMPPEIVSRIFEPFFTTKKPGEGTGLGLSTVYGIVKQNNGYINVYSEPGQGTTFRIYLPRCSGEVKHVTHEITPQTVPGGTETILYVEDDPNVRSATTIFLERLGYSVLPNELPQDALAMAKQYHGSIEMLITDVVLRGMNGRELVTRLLQDRPGMKVLYVSGYTENVISHHGLLEQGVAFLSKPFRREDLARKIRQILDGA